MRERISVVLSYPVCGNLLQQPQETNTGLLILATIHPVPGLCTFHLLAKTGPRPPDTHPLSSKAQSWVGWDTCHPQPQLGHLLPGPLCLHWTVLPVSLPHQAPVGVGGGPACWGHILIGESEELTRENQEAYI